MANSVDTVDVEMVSCEPDSTVEIIDVEEEAPPQTQTALQAMNQQLVERQHLCATMLAASMRERNRVRSELDDVRRQREGVVADFHLVMKLRDLAAENCVNARATVQEAVNKRLALLKEIETEKMWRPPSAVMSLKKQQELRERVEQMRTILGVGKICTPDE